MPSKHVAVTDRRPLKFGRHIRSCLVFHQYHNGCVGESIQTSIAYGLVFHSSNYHILSGYCGSATQKLARTMQSQLKTLSLFSGYSLQEKLPTWWHIDLQTLYSPYLSHRIVWGTPHLTSDGTLHLLKVQPPFTSFFGSKCEATLLPSHGSCTASTLACALTW